MPLALVSLVLLVPGSSAECDENSETTPGQPNVVVIFVDDMGYADIGPFDATGYETPHLNRMAREGMKFTDFVVSSAVCSASRAALLTGCYHRRIGISGALGPKSNHGINAQEVTIAELCKQRSGQSMEGRTTIPSDWAPGCS
jgi:arylsulfatase A-like enzyme